MSRTSEQIVADLAAAARLVPFVDTTTWFDVLFTEGPGGPALLADQPDGALLQALAEEYAVLARHLDTLPAAVQLSWLKDILGVPRLPVVPDRVVAHVTVDPKLAPAVVPKGTLLRGGKDAFGNERRYRTIDALTAHGAVLGGVRSLVPGGTSAGLPGVAASAPELPLTPLRGRDAPHTLRITSPALAFEGGLLTARLSFGGATGVSALAGAVWRYSRADGTISPTATGTVSGSNLDVVLREGCGAPDGDPWLECVVPPTVPVPEGVAFSSVTVAVSARSPFVPQAAFYNDGAVDVSKEFQPFGAVAKRGDAFYVRSDEAFGKAVETVVITVSLLQEGGAPLSPSVGGTGIPGYYATQIAYQLTNVQGKLGAGYGSVKTEIDKVWDMLQGTSEPSVRWQHRVDGQWTGFGTASANFGSVTGALGGAGSQRSTVSGQQGYYVRAFLAEGDFGWTDYQEKLARFATEAVADGDPTMPPLPVPPIASGITISYTTSPVPATRVESTSGWRHAIRPGAGVFRPFRRAVSDTGATGMVAVGLSLLDGALGSTVSLYFAVDSAAPCGVADPVDATWQWWDGSTWQELAVADGSRQLRESGLLRFVAPEAWPEGCPDVSAERDRWVRLVTSAPDRLGDVHAVVVDAVEAEFVSGSADPQHDPSPATALPPGTIKGTLSPIRGVKKVTNLASVRGRGPEADADYRARASARARHRNRAVHPWDYEQHVALEFPEVADVLCLPHTDRTGARSPGSVGLVVVPDRPLDPAPRPSVRLTERIVEVVSPVAPVGADVTVLCPLYAPVTVVATITLQRGTAALTGLEAIRTALESFLHPTRTSPARWGRSLYASSVVAFLEQQPTVDVVTSFDLRDADEASVEVVAVDPCRGLYCSSTAHVMTCEEQL